MTATYKVGAATGSGSMAYATYVILGALDTEHEAAALYYVEQAAGRDVPEPSVVLRPDLSEAFAERLGIVLSRPLSLTELAALMNNSQADGAEIEGKKKHSPHQSVASVFGLDLKELPTAEQVRNVLAGLRADGDAPRSEKNNGPPLPEERVASALRKFKTAIGVPTTRDALPEEIERVAAGKIDVAEYQKHIAATAPAVGYVDLTFSSDKSVSVAYALAPTEAERKAILADVQGAALDAMAYAESVLGWARKGAGGQQEAEPAEMAWTRHQHYTSRPAVDVVRRNAQGEVYTDTREVPSGVADPNLHQHMIVLSSVLSESGRIGSLDLSRLDGELKVMGAVFHAAYATRARKRGTDVVLGPHGEARIAGQPEWVRTFYSRRSTQGEEAARDYAKRNGKDWETLSGEERIELVQAGAKATRQAKIKRKADEGQADIKQWQADAKSAGYDHRSILRPDAVQTVLSDEHRIQLAREASMPLLDAAYVKDAVLPEGKVREIAARGLITSGLGANAAADIEAVIQTYREQGVTVAGKQTKLVWGVEHGADGRPRSVVSTWHNIDQERELIGLVQALAADQAGALTSHEIDAAARRFLTKYPKIDPQGAQWQAGLAMAHTLGEGPRFGIGVGVAGSGKTASVVSVLTDAWHAQGKKVVAMTVPWRATQPLRDAGVDDAMAVDAFIRRVESGKYKIDQNTVIVADEVSMIGVKQQAQLLKVAETYGARLVEIGDPRQCGAVETPALDLIAKTLGDENIPKLLTSIRQKTDRSRAIAGMFRAGRAEEGLAEMRKDGDIDLVAGGAEPTIQRVVASWRRRVDANAEDADYSLIVMAPTNARVLDIGKAIRADRRKAGEIGQQEIVIRARIDPKAPAVDLPLAVGDKIRPFQRLFDADTPGRGKSLASNGDIIEITGLREDGLRVRNAEGAEGRITWRQLKPFRAPKNEPVQLTYGYVSTGYSSQSLTRSEAIMAMVDGSQQVDGRLAYVMLSRHVRQVEVIVSDAAERRQIIGKQMLGAGETPREADVIRNIAANLSRFNERRLATEMQRTPRRQIEPPAPAQTNKPAHRSVEAPRPAVVVKAPMVKHDPFAQFTPRQTTLFTMTRAIADGRLSFSQAIDNLTRFYIKRGGELDKIDAFEAKITDRMSVLAQVLLELRQQEDAMEKKQEKTTQEQRDAARQILTNQQTEAQISQAHEAQRQSEQQQERGLER